MKTSYTFEECKDFVYQFHLLQQKIVFAEVSYVFTNFICSVNDESFSLKMTLIWALFEFNNKT